MKCGGKQRFVSQISETKTGVGEGKMQKVQ